MSAARGTLRGPGGRSVGFAILILGLAAIAACVGRLSGGPPRPVDTCFTGQFSGTERFTGARLSLLVSHAGGAVSAVGWKTPTAASPWELLEFNGRVVLVGEADGRVVLHVPPSGAVVFFRAAEDPTVRLSLEAGASCAARRALTFDVQYATSDAPGGPTVRRRETYDLGREP